MCKHAKRSLLALVKIYFTNGYARTLPFRSDHRLDGVPCANHPERQFLNWLRQMNRAQPGFPTMIRSIYMRVYDQPCDACQTELRRVLGRYRLADRLRYQVVSPAYPVGCSCGCNPTPSSDQLQLALSFAVDDWFGEALLNQSADSELSPAEKSRLRHLARQQTNERSVRNRRHRQTDHGVPLAQVHLDPTLQHNPNKGNLRDVTRRVHLQKEKMWKDYVLSTFFKRCTTPAERRRKLTEIYTELRKQYPRDTISQVFGKEMELLDVRFPNQ